MLTIGKLYPEDAYYTEHGAVQGQYIGEGPTLLGLTDPERDLPALRKGQHPDGSSLVGESPKDHREGFDATFNAPKSVSVLALVAGDERLLAAHREAVREAYRFMEAHAATARVTVDGETRYVKTGNLTGIEFEHTAARPVDGARDPHLHTHIPTINSTQRPDGERRALENRPIVDNIKVYGAIYLGALRRAVEALGYATVRDEDSFRILGVARNVDQHFSTRHDAIKHVQVVHPGMSATKAAIYTREPKSHEINPAGREQRWRDDLQALGYTPESLLEAARREGEQARSRTDGPQPAPAHVSQAASDPQTGREVQAIINALERDTSWWKADEMWRAAVPYLAERLSHQEFARQIEGAVRSGDLIPLDNGRYTSPDALRTEQAIVGHVTNTRTHADPPPAHDVAAIADRWTARNPGQTPTGEQVAAVGFLVRAQDPVVALHGPPGTGKTSVLGIAHDLWREQGHTVTGLAQVKQAAETLQSRTGIPSQTIESYFLKNADPSQTGSSESAETQILVIDEAAVVGSRNMLDLLKAAATQNHVEKIVLVGDTRQLEPIGAGKPFEDLLSRGLIPAADLTQVQRQHEGTLREAVNALYNKDAPRAVDLLDTIGAIREHAELNDFGTPDIPVQAMARDYAALDPERRADTLVQLPTHRHRDAFTDAAREHLKARGEIDRASERTFQVWRPLNLSHADKLDPARYPEGGIAEFFRAKPDQHIAQGARGIIEGVTPDHQLTLRFPADGDRRLTLDPASHWKFNVFEPRVLKVAVGDTLAFGKNDKELGVTNGLRGQVVSLSENSITLRPLTTDHLVTVDPRQYPYLDHGLASTVHKAQGQTVKHAMVGINPDDRHETANRGYTAITRASENVTIYTPSKAGLVASMSEWAAHRTVMGEALGEQGRHAGPDPQGQSTPPPGVTQAPEKAVASSGPTPPTFTSWPEHAVSPPVFPTPDRHREVTPARTSTQEIQETATLPKESQQQGEKTEPGKVTTEVIRYETKDALHLLPAGTPLNDLLRDMSRGMQTKEGSSILSEPFTYGTRYESHQIPAGTSIDDALKQIEGNMRTGKAPERTELKTPGAGQAGEQTTGPFFSQAGHSITPPAIPPPDRERDVTPGQKGVDFTQWPEHMVSPPVFPTPEREREQQPEEKTEKKPEQEQVPKERDQEKEKPQVGSPAKGGADATDTPPPQSASHPDDRRPLNRMGQMIYGPDRLRAAFGPTHWKATAMQPNQTWAKAKYVWQAKSFGEGLRRMTHTVRAVRMQQTWTGRGHAIREAKGVWGTLKAAYAPTAKTLYLVDKPFRGLRHAGRIASAPTIGSAVRRVFERQERVYDPKTKEFAGASRPPAHAVSPPANAHVYPSNQLVGPRSHPQGASKGIESSWKKIGSAAGHAARNIGHSLKHAASGVSQVSRQAWSQLKQQVGKLGRGKTGQTPDKDKPVEKTGQKPATSPGQFTGATTSHTGPFFSQAGHSITPPAIPPPDREREGNKGKTEPEQGKEKKEPEQDTGKGKTEQEKETTGRQTDKKGFDFTQWPEHAVSPPVLPTPEREREQQTTGLTPATGAGQSTGLAGATGQVADRDRPTQAPVPEKPGKDAPHTQEPAQAKDAPHTQEPSQPKDATQSKEPAHTQEPAQGKSTGGKSPHESKGHPDPQKEAPSPEGSRGSEAAFPEGSGKTPDKEKGPGRDKDAPTQGREPSQSKDGPQSKDASQSKEPAQAKDAGGKFTGDPKGHSESRKEASGSGPTNGHEASSRGREKQPDQTSKPDQGPKLDQKKSTRSHQNDRLQFQQGGSSKKSEKGKEDFGRG